MIYFHNLHRPDKPGVVMPWKPLHWRHNERDGVSNHQRLYCLLNCWSRRGSKITSKLRVTGLCVGNAPVTSEFPSQKACGKCFHLMTSSWFPAYGLLNGIIRFTKSITLAPHGRYGVPSQWQLYWLLSSSFGWTSKTNCPYYRPLWGESTSH